MIEYYGIFVYILIAIVLAQVLFAVSFFLVFQNADLEKVSSYECGFNPFQDARVKFDVQFYLVALLFIIFDLEISFMFPWVVILNEHMFLSVGIMWIFLLILTLGFIYEWFKGALDW